MDYSRFLVGLADLKSYLNKTDTGDDDELGFVLGAVHAEMDLTTRRTLYETAHTEYQDGNDTDGLFLENWPVSAVTSVNVDGLRDFGTDTLEDSGDYFTNTELGIVYHNSGSWPAGHANIKVVYTAGYTADTVPADLQRVVLELASIAWQKRKNKNHDVSSESGGDKSRTYFTEPYPPHIEEIIAGYRR